MYHDQMNMIELHDDVVGIDKARLEVKDGQPVKLHTTYILRPNRQYLTEKGADVRLHSTNGVNHVYAPLNSPDPRLDAYRDKDGQYSELDAGSTPEGTDLNYYGIDLNYYDADFQPHETDATRRMRRQQEQVDRTTARKRHDNVGNGAPANSDRVEETKENKDNKKGK